MSEYKIVPKDGKYYVYAKKKNNLILRLLSGNESRYLPLRNVAEIPAIYNSVDSARDYIDEYDRMLKKASKDKQTVYYSPPAEKGKIGFINDYRKAKNGSGS